MIKRNTTIPTTHTETFTTYEDEQTSVIVHITQGERVEASKNRSLGKFILDDIVPAPAGTPKIQVKFDIDVNGILSVSAKDTVTEKEASITIDNNINSEDLNKLLEDGKKYKDEDFNIRQLIEKRNIANKLIYQCEKTIEEYKDKIDGNTLLEFQEAIESTRDNLDVQNPEVINESIKALKQLILQIGEQIYS
jgi:molecular chaperone DnaK